MAVLVNGTQKVSRLVSRESWLLAMNHGLVRLMLVMTARMSWSLEMTGYTGVLRFVASSSWSLQVFLSAQGFPS